MKKLLVSFVLVAILMSGSLVTMATEFTDLGMKIELPNEYYDLKAGIDNNDTKITFYENFYKTTKDELKNEYEQNGIIYNGISSNLSKELIISVIENTRTKQDYHLTLLNDEEIETLKEELINASVGMEKQEQSVYENNGIKFVYSVLKNNTSTVYQYYTIVNGKAITVTLNSKYSNVKKDELKTIIDTIQFNKIQEKPVSIMDKPVIVIGAITITAIILITAIIIVSKKKQK